MIEKYKTRDTKFDKRKESVLTQCAVCRSITDTIGRIGDNTMDILKEHIDGLIKERDNLRTQLQRVEAAISALTGSSTQRENKEGAAAKKKGSKRIAPPGGWATAVENIFYKEGMDGLNVADVIKIIYGKGYDGAKSKMGSNAIRQALYRMVKDKGLLHKDEDGVYRKTDKQVGASEKRDERTIEEVAIEVLKSLGRIAHYTLIMDKMGKEFNYTIPGKDPRQNMTAHLSNSDKIVNHGHGEYGLKEWLPENSDRGEPKSILDGLFNGTENKQ